MRDLTSKLLHFVSLTESFIMLDAKLLRNLWCEVYEIIHFWTAIVDESEEWSSQ